MPIRNLTLPKFHAQDSLGVPLGSGKVYTYQPGTTTAQTTWTDFAMTSENTNPVILDANGEADIWYDEPIKIKLDNSSDVQQWVIDDIPPNAAPTASGVHNFVENGSYEDSTTLLPNWTTTTFTDGTVAVDTSDQNHGKNSIKFTGAGSGGGSATSNKFPVTIGDGLLIKFEYKTSVADTLNSVQIKWFNSAGTALSTDTPYTEGASNPTSYTSYTRMAFAPANAVQAEIILKGVDSGGTTLTANTNFDNILVTAQCAVDNKGVTAAVNLLQVTNSSTGNPVLIAPVGTDTNLGVSITGKGTGVITLDADTVTIADGNNDLDVASHDGTNGLKLAGTLVTSTAVELNIVDGVTSTATEINYLDITTLGTGAASKAVVLDSGDDYTWPVTGVLTYGVLNDGTTALTSTVAELNILDGVTSTAAELNVLDGVTSTAAELNILDGVTSTATELNYNDITTLGTVQASKGVTADSSGNANFPSGTNVQSEAVDIKPLVSGTAVATTSGTSVAFTSIPSWVKRITLSLSDVSTDGTGALRVEIGDSGGYETTGYNSVSSIIQPVVTNAGSLLYFIITSGTLASGDYSGHIVLTLVDPATNTWSLSSCISDLTNSDTAISAGTKSLSATLDRIKLEGGGDTFDAGKMNILYE